MKLGWNYIDESWYYFNGSGAMVTGWLQTGCYWYYLDHETGKMATGLTQVDNIWYYMDSSGAMRTGWEYVDGSWYYLNGSGAMVTGWLQTGGYWYYLDHETGKMATWWKQVDNIWYYMDSSGAMERNKMFRYNDGAYYVGHDGAMKTSEFRYIGNVTFHPDANGLISLQEYNLYKPQVDAMENANAILRKVGNSLWEAYKWAGSAITYRTMSTDPNQGISYFANIGFNQGSGNCYTMASTFYYLAYALGYDVYQISGFHQGYYREEPHSWCEIQINGNTYIYDPDVLKETGRTIYGSSYGQKGTLKYILSKRQYMNI